VRILSSLTLTLGLAMMGGGPQGFDNSAERLRAMRVLADGITMQTAPQRVGAPLKLERLTEPVSRFDDPARQFSDGTIWAWCRAGGRPEALLTLSKKRLDEGSFLWLVELTSLTANSGPITATVPEIGIWRPGAAGVVMREFPKAPPPAEDPAKRLRQMRDLVRQIKAYEFFKPEDHPSVERYELRVLPQPAHRYADPKAGLVDGGLFIISYGLNPELVLLVEARREGPSAPAWHYGFARISIARVHVDFDSKEIWSHPGGYPQGPNDIYWIFTKPGGGE
jgi:hypothetical protein